MMKRQLLNDEYHGQQPPQEWEDQFASLLTDDLAPTSAVFAPAIAWQGLTNARHAGWAV